MRCGWCGRFISYKDKDAITYTSFGSYFDTTPPDATDVCGKCWNKLSNEQKYFYKAFTWRPATKLFSNLETFMAKRKECSKEQARRH